MPQAQDQAAATAMSRGRKMKNFTPDTAIHVETNNPYREGSKRHIAFALYRDGLTVKEFLAAGGKTYDLNRALRDGFITIAAA